MNPGTPTFILDPKEEFDPAEFQDAPFYVEGIGVEFKGPPGQTLIKLTFFEQVTPEKKIARCAVVMPEYAMEKMVAFLTASKQARDELVATVEQSHAGKVN